MRTLKRSILLSNLDLPAASFIGSDNGFDLTPWQDFSWAESLTFAILVVSETGLTSGSLAGKFQHGIIHAGGAYQYATQVLSDFGAVHQASHILEGQDFGTMWAHSQATNVTFERTVLHPGPRCNLRLWTPTPLAGGGTVRLCVTLLQKGS